MFIGKIVLLSIYDTALSLSSGLLAQVSYASRPDRTPEKEKDTRVRSRLYGVLSYGGSIMAKKKKEERLFYLVY